MQAADDGNTYRVWQKTDTVREGRYLVDAQGVPQYIVDPAINGQNSFVPTAKRWRSSTPRKPL